MHEHQSHDRERQADADDHKEDAAGHEGPQPFHPRIYVASLVRLQRRADSTARGSTPPKMSGRCIAASRRCSRARRPPEQRSGRSTTTMALTSCDSTSASHCTPCPRSRKASPSTGPLSPLGRAHVGVDSSDLDEFEDAYMGEWESGRAFAEEMLDDMGHV